MKNWENEREPLNKEKISKGIGKSLEAKLNKKYTPDSTIDALFKGNDITFITNENGEPITLYIGKRKENGDISGDRFSRRIKKREGDKIVDSHWDRQGKV